MSGERLQETAAVTDEALMARYLAGDESAFEAVYRKHREGVRWFFTRQCGSAAVGQELGQEVWFKVIRAVQNESYSADGKFTTYLYRIARNQLIDWYRKNGSYTEVEMDETTENEGDVAAFGGSSLRNPEDIYADQQAVQSVMEGIEELPEAQRMTLMMYLESDMSYEEIAEATGTNRETVKSRLRYARKVLRQRIVEN